MRAQIEQVGKNVAACLKAVGAVPSDIVLTRTYVTDATRFEQDADSARALSRPGAQGQHDHQTPELAGRDFLVEIEAVAVLN
jgi:enamine deaminase RidA (YjgF/YER057c/UK114 family)